MEKVKILNDIEKTLNGLNEFNPLVHCITNYVTVNDCANALLAIGASPIMADAIEEVQNIVSISKSLVLNIGTLNSRQNESIIRAGKKANELGIPIILDPVGAGASKFRNETIVEITKECDVDMIRGNMSEIKALGGVISKTHGVDVNEDDLVNRENLEDNKEFVYNLSNDMNTTIVASGPIDIISNGEDIYYIENGNEMMSLISGTGCMLSSIVGAYSAISSPLTASITALAKIEISAQEALKTTIKDKKGIGSFKVNMFDELYKTTPEKIIKDLNLNRW